MLTTKTLLQGLVLKENRSANEQIRCLTLFFLKQLKLPPQH